MKLIENITNDEIRINIQRQANNLYDQVATKDAILELHEASQIVENMTNRSYAKMKAAVKNEVFILEAVREKIQMFRELSEEYEQIHEGEDVNEDSIEDIMTEASAENSTH
jgi:hypothetical protein